jgi:hypothetical protein
MKLKVGIAVAFIVAQLLLAAMFALEYGGYSQDEGAGLRDVSRYVADGVTIESLRDHVNAAGPLAFVAMAMSGEAVGDLHLGSRLLSLFAAAASALLMFRIARCIGGSKTAAAIASALLLVNPYAPLAAGSMLTESFSIMLLLFGVYLWIGAISLEGQPTWSPRIWAAALVLGLSVTSRQYYLAVIFALWCTNAWLDLRRFAWRESAQVAAVALRHAAFGLVMVAPIAFLVAIWGGLAPPLLRDGISHPGWDAEIGINLYRPLSAMMLCGLYSLPLAVLLVDRTTFRPRPLFTTALLSLCLAAALDLPRLFCDSTQQVTCGPVDAVFSAVATIGLGAPLAAVMLWVAMLCLLAIGKALRPDAGRVLALQIMAVTALAVFVLEQVFVGGNIPFYDRYIHQVWPLLVLAVGLARLDHRVAALALASIPYIVYGNWRVVRLLVG